MRWGGIEIILSLKESGSSMLKKNNHIKNWTVIQIPKTNVEASTKKTYLELDIYRFLCQVLMKM